MCMYIHTYKEAFAEPAAAAAAEPGEPYTRAPASEAEAAAAED